MQLNQWIVSDIHRVMGDKAKRCFTDCRIGQLTCLTQGHLIEWVFQHLHHLVGLLLMYLHEGHLAVPLLDYYLKI